MYFQQLANELVFEIFHACNTIQDTQALASTCHRFRALYSGSQKLPILISVSETQYGPLHDAIQIVTQNSSEPAHLVRSAPLSLALVKQLLTLGKAAQKWVDVYPTKKWKSDYQNRRSLLVHEAYELRRAVYRLWLYTRAFHNARFSRTGRTVRGVVLERAELLRNWSTAELAQMLDVHAVLRDVVQSHVCPSNGTIQRKFRKRFPDADVQLQFNIHLNYPPPPPALSAFQQNYYSHHQATAAGSAAAANLKWKTTALHEVGSEGWGDDIPHYYVVEDMLKLDPGEILWLKENAPLKGMVEVYVKSLGEWFENNGETFGQTLQWVLSERGEDVEEIKDAVMERDMGIVID